MESRGENIEVKILILEDSEIRIKQFLEGLESDTNVITVKHTAQDCIDCLTKESWDVLFLDHDLGGKTYVATDDKNTGSEVCRWLSNNNVKIRLIIIHSLNVQGQRTMKQLVPQAIIVPFVWMKITKNNLNESTIKYLNSMAEEQSKQLRI